MIKNKRELMENGFSKHKNNSRVVRLVKTMLGKQLLIKQNEVSY